VTGGSPADQGPPPGGYPPPPAGAYPPPPAGAYSSPDPRWGAPAPAYPNPGAYPPPPAQGFYPPPPAQGFYPPPPPAQGFYPPPPPAQGYYPPPPSAQGGYAPPPPGWGRPAFSIGEALSWAWAKFTKNALPLIVATVALFGVLMIITAIPLVIEEMMTPADVTAYGDGGEVVEIASAWTLSGAGLAFTTLTALVVVIVGAVAAAAYFVGLLDIANGQKVAVGSFFRPRNVKSVVIASVLLGLITVALQVLLSVVMVLFPIFGLLLAFVILIPSLAISVFTLFATLAIIDRNLAPIDGIKDAWRVTKANFGQVALVALVVGALIFVGLLACGVGVLVAIPVAYLLVTYAYRKLSGGTVAPATF
jgi:uncharacterized membrane protein